MARGESSIWTRLDWSFSDILGYCSAFVFNVL